MNIVLGIVQILLAFHTAVGAIWKLSNWFLVTPLVPGIPREGWLLICVLELVCSVALILSLFINKYFQWAIYAAGFVMLEMLAYTFIHLASGGRDTGAMTYWLVVAAVAGLTAYARFMSKPSIKRKK